MSTKPNATELLKRKCPKEIVEIEAVIRASRGVNGGCSFERLAEAIRQTEGFLEKTLPFLWQEAIRAQEALPDIPLLDRSGTVILTQRQCLCILANAFFCTFTDRPSNNCVSGTDLPSINLDELYDGYVWGVEVAKLLMLFNYFEQCRQRQIGGDPLARPIHTIRRRAENSTAGDWEQCRKVLLPPIVHPLRKSLDEAKGMLRVDFANRIIGGGAIAYGCVQEEIMFCVCPELIVTRLFCPAMKRDEAIVIIGAEQFSTPMGYGSELEYGGRYIDLSPLRKDCSLGSYVVAIDAFDFRSGSLERQYSAELILRELCKAWAGFDVQEAPSEVATGNWGCGVFEGDAELKSILQWLATSRAGKVLHYFPWDNEKVHSALPELAAVLVDRGVTVGEVTSFLIHALRPSPVYAQLKGRFTG